MLRDEFEEVLADGSNYMEGFIALLADIIKAVAAEKDAWVSVHGSFFGASGLYIFCCLAAMRGKLDITIYKRPSSPKLNLNFINPFKKKKEKDEDQIPFYRKVSSIDENQTDTDTCWITKKSQKNTGQNGGYIRQAA